MTADPTTVAASTSPWTPLRNAVFRSLWLALLASNVGTWMQTVGAQWLLLDVPNAATLVALVQTASTLPILLLALPAGAIADMFDKRRMLIAVQVAMVAVGVMLTALTATDHMAPALLLTLTFGLGVGQALTLPAWQAIIPDLIARPQLPSAAALGAISQNLARAIGPAVAGVVISQAGVEAVFALNTVSFALFAVVLWRWRGDGTGTIGAPERFAAAVRAGGRYVRHSPVVRRILMHAALFVLPASALWALLPLVASRQLGLDAGGYGLLLGALGVGAVIGAILLPRIRERMSMNEMLAWSGLAYGLTLVVVALVRIDAVVLVTLLLAGLAWVAVLSSINAALQMFLPGWVRARGLSIYQIVFAAGLGLGSLLWGALAQMTSLAVALIVAAGSMAVGVGAVRLWPTRDVSMLDRSPVFVPVPELVHQPDPDDGPVLITVTYSVSAENQREFFDAMQLVRRTRRRSGATQWGLFKEGERANRFVEVYLVSTWDEHLRQHTGRLTGADRTAQHRVRALAVGAPEVTHLLPAEPAPSPEDG